MIPCTVFGMLLIKVICYNILFLLVQWVSEQVLIPATCLASNDIQIAYSMKNCFLTFMSIFTLE